MQVCEVLQYNPFNNYDAKGNLSHYTASTATNYLICYSIGTRKYPLLPLHIKVTKGTTKKKEKEWTAYTATTRCIHCRESCNCIFGCRCCQTIFNQTTRRLTESHLLFQTAKAIKYAGRDLLGDYRLISSCAGIHALSRKVYTLLLILTPHSCTVHSVRWNLKLNPVKLTALSFR